MDAATLKAGAVARILATRRKPPKFRAAIHPESGEVIRAEDRRVGGSDDFTAAATVSEWCDDRLARMAPGAAGELLAAIVEAMRLGEDAAVLTVSTGRRLNPWDQHAAWSVLSSWSGGPPGVESLLRAVRAEWQRMKLQTSRPDPASAPYPQGATVGPGLDAAPGAMYSPSVPMEMRLPGRGRVNP